MYNFNGLIVSRRLIASTAFKYGRGWDLTESPWTWFCYKCGLFNPDHFGAFITTTITFQQRSGFYTDKKRPWKNIRIYPHKVLNKFGWQNCGMRRLIQEELPKLNKKRIKKCIISIGAVQNIYEIFIMIDMLSYCDCDIAGIEINTRCHNVDLCFLENKEILTKLFKESKRISRYPLIVKLCHESDYLTIAKIAQDQGINLLHAINTTKAYHKSLGDCAQSSYKNKPIALMVIDDLRKNGITIPIIGGSGIWTAQDIIDYKNAGADLFSMSHQFIYLPFWPAILAKAIK